MSANMWFIIAIISFLLAAVSLIITIILFVKLNILSVIGDLSGKKVAREVKAIRSSSLSGNGDKYHPKKVMLDQNQNIDKKIVLNAEAIKQIHASKRLDAFTGDIDSNGESKSKVLDYDPVSPTVSLSDEATQVLKDDATELLDENRTERLLSDAERSVEDYQETHHFYDATEVLDDVQIGESLAETTVLEEGTTVLDKTEKLLENQLKPIPFKVVDTEIYVHTDEVIELSGET